MNILAVDDERLVLNNMLRELEIVFPNDSICGKKSGKEALAYANELKEKNEKLDYAFLDIQLRDYIGIDLGKQLKEIFPETKVIFCTAYTEYACESYQMNAIGYLLKPVGAEDIVRTLEAMDKDWVQARILEHEKKEIVVQTFGTFEVFVNGKPVVFEREKAREILAYLIDRRGELVTVAEIAEVMFEDKVCDRKTMNQIYAIMSSLKKSLKDAEILDIYRKTLKYVSVDMTKLICDFIRLEEGDVLALNAYKGNYLECYSWGEFTNAEISAQTDNYVLRNE